MTEKTAYKFCYQPLGNGSEELANALGHQGWTLDHVALSGSFLLLVFSRPTPPHQTTDRGDHDVPTTP